MIEKIIKQAELDCESLYKKVNSTVEKNQQHVLEAFKKNRIGDFHFNSTDGYGYDDVGRDGLESLYADVFGTEDALVRPQIVSGTHAISTTLFGLLRPGDELVYITGGPYDTLEEVIGLRGGNTGSLKDYQVEYNQVALNHDGSIDYPGVKAAISNKTKVIGIQRSKGYDDRPSFTIKEIEKMVKFVKEIEKDLVK